MGSHRLLSVSESSTLLDCSWRWDLSYGGHLAGAALTPRETPMLLREGKAWGRAMAALHGSYNLTTHLVDAEEAIRQSIREDAEERLSVRPPRPRGRGLGGPAAARAACTTTTPPRSCCR